MANTYVDYTATAGQTDFAFSFPYLEDSHVVVELEGVDQTLTTNYTIETSPAQKIVLSSPTTAIAGGELVRIKRVSDPSTNLVDFVNGSVLTETELDRAYLHNRYLSEEAYDGVNAGLGEVEGSTNYNANNKQIKNLADGTLATDAVNKGYVDTQIALTDTNLAGFFKSTHTGNGTDNVFTLSFTPQTTEAEAYIVSIDGLVQVPDTDYTIGATDITFNTIPANSAEICVVATAASSVATVNEAQVTATGSSQARSLAKRFADVVNVLDYGAKGDGVTDDTTAIQNALNVTGTIYFSAGTYKITSALNISSNSTLMGDGKEKTVLYFYKASNPASDEFMLKAEDKTNITVKNLTLSSNAYDDGLFNLGTYTTSPVPHYTANVQGRINGLLISSCTNVNVLDCEVRYFNYHGIRVSVTQPPTPATTYNENLVFDNIHGHHCRQTPISILGTKNFKVTNCTLTDNGYFGGNIIDGGGGYGVVLGRTPSSNQLRSIGGVCSNNFCARNARHGIDGHAGTNLIITNNIVEDNLLQGISVQDLSGSADDTLVGNVTVANNTIYHTSWVESKYSLMSWYNATDERPDSIPIFVSQVGQNLLQNVVIESNVVRGWRFRQLVTNVAGTDLIGFVSSWGVDNVRIANNTFEADDVDYLPSFGLGLTAKTAEVVGNSWQSKQRSTVSKPFWRFNTTESMNMSSNHFELLGVYTDNGVTTAAYPMFEKIGGELTFNGNTIIQPTQGLRGSIWYATRSNHLWGFNGVAQSCVGNTLKKGGITWIEYGSHIQGSLEIYISSVGAGRFDGFSSGNAFAINSKVRLEEILDEMPRCEQGLIINVVDDVNLGSDTMIEIPENQNHITFRGNTADNTNSMTKTAGFTSTGGNQYFIICPEHKDIDFEYLKFTANSFVSLLYRPRTVKFCAFDTGSSGTENIIFSKQIGFAEGNRFKDGAAGISAIEASSVISKNNDSDATAPDYGLKANSAHIYKNGTQPTGGIANETTSNGGAIT